MKTMDIIEVDPKLFVMCRLCLEHSGQYQIVPSVQQQIKYCFDIEVEPFDGLPQLICMKCKEILNEYHTIKTTICAKQNNLKSRVSKKDDIHIQPQHDTVSSSQQTSEIKVDSKKKKSKKKRPCEQSPFDVESEKSFHSSKSKKSKASSCDVVSPMMWQSDYKRRFLCKICNKFWPSKISISNHIRSHDFLKERYKNIFSRQCTVNLVKIDDKPNITGLSNMVVHNINKIIVPGNSLYHTVFIKDGDNADNSNHYDITDSKNAYNTPSQVSSDDDELVVKPNIIRRKRRLLSKSSNETVLIASNNNKILSDYEEDCKPSLQDGIDTRLSTEQCINIDDSSDGESTQGNLESSQRAKQPMEAKLSDYKIIQGIISMCLNSYHKKNESTENDTVYNMNANQNKKNDAQLSQLKHKVLSIGRKIINKQGFNCTGLLRYMEQKNLEIVWMTKTMPSYSNKETNYIRILTKLRGPENTSDKNLGWVKVSKMPQSHSFNSVPVIQFIQEAVPDKSLSPVPVIHHPIHDTTSQTANSETGLLEQVNKQNNIDTTPAMLYLDSKGSSTDSKKILNANPVANPKQLPKKLASGSETRFNKSVIQHGVPHTSDDDANFCLPIITSTTSLAVAPTTEQNQNGKQSSSVSSGVVTNTEAPAPRIKVKPVSELMSERTLNNLMSEQSSSVTNGNMLITQMDNVWQHPNTIQNMFIPNIAPQINVSSQQLQLVTVPNLHITPTYQIMPSPTETNINQEWLVLDTADFPNTKSQSPFKYFKDLLQMHSLYLLDSFDILPEEYKCLIKFRVVLKQEGNNQAVVLCLSLFCLNRNFCLQVRSRNQEIIDVYKLSAFWQWEILQMYRGDVVVKVLQNAKKVSNETFDFTNKFFCVLKSIKCNKI